MSTSMHRESARALSNRELVREIIGKATLLAKKEIELAKAEIRQDLGAELGMVKALGIAAILALLALNAFVVAGILALALIVPGWASALIVGGGLLIIAAIIGYIGWRHHVRNPLDTTRESLKKDVQWIKERAA